MEMSKILNGYENIERNIFFSVKEERRTKGHAVTLTKNQCRLDMRKYSFSQRTVNEWNRLSGDCVGASSVNMFKNKIDKRAGYTQIEAGLSISQKASLSTCHLELILGGNLIKSC